MSVMRVPLGDPPKTTRPTPLARCRWISDGLLRRPVCKAGAHPAWSSSWRGIASNIDQQRSNQLVAKGSVFRPNIAEGVQGAWPLPYSGHARTRLAGFESESRQPLRTVVGDLHAADLVERTIRLGGVANQL